MTEERDSPPESARAITSAENTNVCPSISAAESEPPRKARRKGRRDWLAALVPVGSLILAALLFFLKRTTRWRYVNGEALFARWARGEPTILAFWHDRLVMMPFPHRGHRVFIMVSQHRDGELIARAARPFGVEAVRGSSTRGWSGALRGLLRAYRSGADLAVAPDGPRGPRHVAKSGVVQLGRATGAPIIPITAAPRWRRTLGSWDRLIVPLPGSRIVYMAGTPLTVAPNAGPAEIEAVRAALERELTRITDAAETAVGR